MNKEIKWCAIQPLTGGMYLGTEEAIGHKAEFILSFPGIGEVTETNKETNEVTKAGNEYSLMKYLEKKNRMPEYRVFNRQMFQNDNDLNPEILTCRWSQSDTPLDYSNMDLCIAVPVCSGLSRASATMTPERRDQANCNMLWITKYALNKIQPRCYIFENAPSMMNQHGTRVRHQLEEIAKAAGYCVCYYKTNTLYHSNAQKRLRTFILFFKQDDMNNIKNPKLGFEHNSIDIKEYLAMIPEDATQQISLHIGYENDIFAAYYQNKFGDNWFEQIDGELSQYMIDNKLFEDVKAFANSMTSIDDNTKKKFEKFINHIKEKSDMNMGFYSFLWHRSKTNTSRAIMFKTMVSEMHPTKLRLMTIREHLWLMGMPFDFEIQGDVNTEYRKIGQNVPVKTSKWIVTQALEALNDNEPKNTLVRYFDNVAMKEQNYEEIA